MKVQVLWREIWSRRQATDLTRRRVTKNLATLPPKPEKNIDVFSMQRPQAAYDKK